MNKMKYLAGCEERSFTFRPSRSPRYFILFMDSSLYDTHVGIFLLKNNVIVKIFLGLFGALCIGFGQTFIFPAAIASFCGYGLISVCISCLPSAKKQFFAAWALYALAFLIKDFWLTSHPYAYIYVVWILFSAFFALPYAYLSYRFVSQKTTVSRTFGFAALFTLCEYLYTILPCGYSFQSAALHVYWNIFLLQLLNIGGSLGLSFLVYVNNCFFYLAIAQKKYLPLASSLILPIALGFFLYENRKDQVAKAPLYHVAICHLEEEPVVDSAYLPPNILHEQKWQKVFSVLAPLQKEKADLLILPEGSIPFSVRTPLFPSNNLPLHLPFPFEEDLSSFDICFLLSHFYKTPIVVGLEAQTIDASGKYHAHNSCFYFPSDSFQGMRYDKQLLLPLGEYIPYEFLEKALSAYGIHAGFTPGKQPIVFPIKSQKIAPLICYEETFTKYHASLYDLHPTLFVGLSNDVWYPSVGPVHAELARYKALEMGLPMVRSCNKGKSGAYDALGNCLLSLDKNSSVTIVSIPMCTTGSFFHKIGESGVVFILFALSIAALLLKPFKKRSQ